MSDDLIKLLFDKNKSKIDLNIRLDKSADATTAISLYNQSTKIGTIGITKGLEDYYNTDLFEFKITKEIKNAIKQSKNKNVITQVQGFSKGWSASNRKKIIKFVKNIFEETGEPIEYFLTANLNFYRIKEIQNGLIETHQKLPKIETLLLNYDYTATKTGFKRDKLSDLYIIKNKF